MISRRQFLRAGAAAGVLLVGLRHLPSYAAGATRAGALTDAQREVIAAIAPVMLDDALPAGSRREASIIAVVDGVDAAIAGLPPHLRDELDELFMVLTFSPTRLLLARVWRPWQRASTENIAAFLQSWRTSGFGLLQSGYQALHELIMASWYAQPDSWQALHYPGPPGLS